MANNDIRKTVDLPQLDICRAMGKNDETSQMQIVVGKAYRGGSIDVTVSIGGTDGVFFSFMMFADFHKVVASKPAKRVTAKAIEKMADEHITDENIELWTQFAIAHYAERLNKKIAQDGYVLSDTQREFFKQNAAA